MDTRIKAFTDLCSIRSEVHRTKFDIVDAALNIEVFKENMNLHFYINVIKKKNNFDNFFLEFEGLSIEVFKGNLN